MDNPENFAQFYKNEKLGFDLRLVDKGFNTFKSFFKGESCLELGPATGYMTKHLVNYFKNVTLVEGSSTLINQIPNYRNVEKINCLFEEFNSNHKFDTIILNHVLEHIEDPNKLLKMIYNWLSDDGICIIGVPNAKSFHRLAAVKMGLLQTEYELNSRDKELGHFRIYDLDLLKKQTTNVGFKIKHEGGIFLKFLSNSQIEQFLPDEVIDAYFDLAQNFYNNSAEIYIVLNK
jgi:2-polyprenyl-3-methyl-5-hydroxy-6-metoxy-1,4-benzoquinol methylase